VPAITDIAQLDAQGREQVRVSRVAADAIGSQTDFSRDPIFVEAIAKKRSQGPVYFRRESEPYMSPTVAGASPEYGVVVAEVNLKFIWDVGSDTLDALAKHTGMRHSDLLQGLSQQLPGLVDKLTPHGRLPTEREAQQTV
jgi:hypothetical protein